MARFLKYLQARGLAQTANRKVWVFCGDGEMDEPESLGAIGLAAREKLDNLIFVVNCNLQRLDGPVRGNGKIIQELEGDFRGAGWNVIKVIWGSYWDPLLARDKDGILLRVMEETVDGEYQNYKANDGAFVRKHFFGKHPEAARDGRAHDRRGHLAPEPRRPRPAQGLRGVRGGGEAQGPADRDPRQDHQGLRPGQAGAGEEPDAPAEEDRHLDHQGDARPVRDPDPGRQARRAAVLHSAGRFAGDEVPARAQARRSAATCRSAARRRTRFRRYRRSNRSSSCSRAPAKAARSRPPWRSCACSPRWCATRRSASTWCRSCPTRRAPSAWKACSASSASSRPRGQKYEPVDKDQVMFYREDKAGPDPRGRHQRGGRVLVVDRGGDLVQPFEPGDGAVLHLLFDVRLAAHRRPRLGGGRSARARLPARRHRRAAPR